MLFISMLGEFKCAQIFFSSYFPILLSVYNKNLIPRWLVNPFPFYTWSAMTDSIVSSQIKALWYSCSF